MTMNEDWGSADMTTNEFFCGEDGFCCDANGNCWEEEGRWEDENRGEDYQYYLDRAPIGWFDNFATTWEHKRDFHENCYNWNKFMSC